MWLYAIKGTRVKVDSLMGGGLYKEYNGCIVTWSVTEPYANLNCFTWSKDEDDWIILGYQYNEEFKN